MANSNETDDIIEALRAAQAREALEDQRWDALTRGALSAEEADALRREAPDRYALHRPFTVQEQERVIARVMGELPEPRPAVVALWQRPIARAAAGFALAAGVALALFLPQQHGPTMYGWSTTRGGDKPVAKHVSGEPDAVLTEVLVPRGGVGSAVVVRGALLVPPERADPSRARALPLVATVTSDHEIILTGTRIDLFAGVKPGEWDVVVALGPPGETLPEEKLRSLADQGSSEGLQVLRKRIVLDGQCIGTKDRPCAESPR